MIVYPNAKINIGLDIINKRSDGYHDLSSVFYPLLDTFDILEIIPSDEFEFSSSGIPIPSKDNMCAKAWEILHNEFGIGNVSIHLHKLIPVGAGLGGGSSDASFTLKVLNDLFNLSLSNRQLEIYALDLGADCPFFIDNTPKHVLGIGEKMTNIDLDLSAYDIQLVDPRIHISTREAYNGITPHLSKFLVEDIIKLPVNEWKIKITNDFEESIFKKYSQLKDIKADLYSKGALFVSMSGSGSVLFGIFDK